MGLSKTAASNRYIRALERLKERLNGLPGFLTARPEWPQDPGNRMAVGFGGSMESNTSRTGVDPVDELAEEYLNRRRNGEHPPRLSMPLAILSMPRGLRSFSPH